MDADAELDAALGRKASAGRRARTKARWRAIRRGVCPSRNDPHHAPTIDQPNSLLLNPNFLDRLLGEAYKAAADMAKKPMSGMS